MSLVRTMHGNGTHVRTLVWDDGTQMLIRDSMGAQMLVRDGKGTHMLVKDCKGTQIRP